MQIQKLNYAIREDRGTLLSARRNVIRVGDPDPSEKAFDCDGLGDNRIRGDKK